MTCYCDTSLLIAVLVTEAHTNDARAWFGDNDAASLAISGWVSAEAASALARKQRMGQISPVERARAQRLWNTAFAARLRTVDIRPEDFARASWLVDAGQRGLRAADALHLAIAERHGFQMATLDVDLADAARAVGLEVPVIRRAA